MHGFYGQLPLCNVSLPSYPITLIDHNKFDYRSYFRLFSSIHSKTPFYAPQYMDRRQQNTFQYDLLAYIVLRFRPVIN